MFNWEIDAWKLDNQMIWIDVSDIHEYFVRCDTVTGIQRVAISIIEPISSEYDMVRLIAFDERTGSFREIEAGDILCRTRSERAARGNIARKIVLSSALVRNGAEIFGALLSKFRKPRRQEECAFKAGDSILFLGAFWQNDNHVNRLIDVSFSHRLKLHVLVHDIIPVSHRSWFSGDYVAGWQDRIERLIRASVGIFVNSMVTASTLEDHLAKAGIKGKPIKVLRFGDPILNRPPAPRAHQTKLVTTRNFVLMVSSIDVRKNQMALLFVWNRLIKEHGEAIPDLVLIGKDSIGHADIHAMVARSEILSERVRFVQDADDAAVARYYENCLFTVFPSFAEGWGFPVAESLMFGKACVASKATSIPEVGGALCRYVDPHNLEEIYQAIEAFIFDEPLRNAFTQKIAAEYKSTTWESTARTVVETILAADDPVNSSRGTFENSLHV